MSVDALRWVRGLRVSPAQKCLLWALADAANDAGECWPSMAALREWTCLSERALQAAVQGLVARGAVVVVAGGGRGRTTRYCLQVGAELRPETPQRVRGCRGATPQEARGLPAHTPRLVRGIGGETPQRARGKRPETPHLLLPLPGKTPQQVRGEPPLDSPRGVSDDHSGSARRERGARLAPDWWPDAEDRSFAADLGLDVDWVAAQFRDHWHAKTGADATKRDWRATWRRWCRNEIEWAARRGGQRRARANDGSWMDRSIYEADPDERPIIDMVAEG